MISNKSKDLVLVGGGHAHALLIKMWGMATIPDIRITLISPDPLTPYSGMLPGYLAGIYSHEEIHINLLKLCSWAGVRFIIDEVVRLDPEKKILDLSDTGPLEFDILSINTGSTPLLPENTSAKVCPVKPVARFIKEFDRCVAHGGNQSIAVIGGGASGAEVALNLALRIPKAKIAIVHGSSEILTSYPKMVRRLVAKELNKLGVQILLNKKIESESDGLISGDGWQQKFDQLFWTTQASAPAWLKYSGVATDDKGFLHVNRTLQSLSQPYIFGAGDAISIQGKPLAKSGVYAVRAGKILFQNIQNFALGEKLATWNPQKSYLSLIGIGGKTAIAARGKLGVQAQCLWNLKDSIDRNFMAKFSNLSAMPDDALYCRGCAAKAAPETLAETFDRMISAGVSKEDAAQVEMGNEKLLLSLDRISAIVDDPYTFARIAVNHALSDIFASQGKPSHVLLGVEIPRNSAKIQTRDLKRILSGARTQCSKLGVGIAGGHTSIGDELALSIAVLGQATRKDSAKKNGNIGDLLILSKPLGIGIAFAGLMRQVTSSSTIEESIRQMLIPNQIIAGILQDLSIEAVTDVTGFGLLGHLLEMLHGDLGARLYHSQIPMIPGVDSLLKKGIESTSYPQNSIFLQNLDYLTHQTDPRILCDPQTSGGLLAAVPKVKIDELNSRIADLGAGSISIIGEITRREKIPVILEK